MTNTKFRKRALLSSIAMLLVALVALGSATFAWFVANPTVTASGLQMKTIAAPGLKVASESDKVKNGSYTFDSTANLANQNFSLTPASPDIDNFAASSLALGFGSIKALADTDEARDTTANFASLTPMTITSYASSTFGTTTGGGDVYYEDLYFQKSGTGSESVTIKAVSVKIDSVNNDIAKGVKVALVAQIPGETATYSLLGIWKANSGDNTSYWAGATNNSNLSSSSYTYTASEATVKDLTIPVGNESAGAGATIRAYVYLDGENQYTYSANATDITNLITGLTIKVSTENSNISFS